MLFFRLLFGLLLSWQRSKADRRRPSCTENAAGVEVWRLIFDLVRNLNEVIMQTLPPFWKVAKGYMEGKYQKVRICTPSLLSFTRSTSLSSRRTIRPLPPPPPAALLLNVAP